MGVGKWFLAYDYVDTFGGGLGERWETKEVPLNAIAEDEAIKEAVLIWTEKRDETKKNARVIYKINLS